MTRTVLVTGASGGLGQQCVEVFASQGWNVIAATRTPDSMDSSSTSPRVLPVYMDVRNEDSIARAMTLGLEHFPTIDVLVNNAAFGLRGVFEGIPSTEVQRQIDVNLLGPLNACRAVLPQMRRQGSGTIINISSPAGRIGLPLSTIYAASKFALEGFSEALSHEVARLNIAVKVVVPGGMLGTHFEESSRRASECVRTPVDYAEIQRRADRVYAVMADHVTASARDVALVVFQAATDGTRQYRYVASEEMRAMFSSWRQTAEQEFLDRTRGRILGAD
jgi:NAD(P)-dependent dehydrogenase (short-subunit alcohol dehydrogenase family)